MTTHRISFSDDELAHLNMLVEADIGYTADEVHSLELTARYSEVEEDDCMEFRPRLKMLERIHRKMLRALGRQGIHPFTTEGMSVVSVFDLMADKRHE